MRSDSDRFFTIVCCCAFVITAGVVVLTHQGTNNIKRAPAASTAATAETYSRPSPAAVAEVPVAMPSQAVAGATFASQVSESSPENSRSAELADRIAEVVFDLAKGETPLFDGSSLPELNEVLVYRDSDDRMVVAPGTHRRYDRMVNALAELGSAGLAATIEDLEPQISREFSKVAAADDDFRSSLAEAVNELLAVELPTVEPDMVRKVEHWGFADADFEALSAAQKHLLLMGRDNARTVRTLLSECHELLALPAALVDRDLTPDPFDEIYLARSDSPVIDDLAEATAAP